MIKQLIILAQFLGLFFYQLFFSGDLSVTQKVKSTIKQGEEAVVEITINKGDLPGFAKIQQSFPAGFTAEPIETKGATFSFVDNKLKFIWMSLPEEGSFTISYKIIPGETVEGDFLLGGKFSFISDSERKNIEIPTSNFKVIKKVEKDEPIIAAVTPEETVENLTEEVIEEVVAEEVIEEVVAETVEAEKPVKVEPSEESSNTLTITSVFCKRIVENVGKGKFKVTVEINKKGVEGFCKVTEKIPAGFVASENESKKGVFSFKNNTMKILWMGAPKEEVYNVSYFVQAESNTENGWYDIIGYYSYLENDATSKFVIDGSRFNYVKEELVAEEPVIVTPPVEEVVAKKEVVKEVVEEAVVAKVEPVAKTNVAKEDVTSVPKPEGNVTYKVQVGAGHKQVPSTYFATVFKLKDKVSTINHEGWIKYLVGSYSEYKGARDKRNVVRNNVKRAFVTAYNAGTRITVQEALMISNQKWYK